MTTTKKQERTFADNFMDNIADIGNALLMDFVDRRGIPSGEDDGLVVNIEDKPDVDGVARHFYHGDKRIFTLYLGKQGVTFFKPKW